MVNIYSPETNEFISDRYFEFDTLKEAEYQIKEWKAIDKIEGWNDVYYIYSRSADENLVLEKEVSK